MNGKSSGKGAFAGCGKTDMNTDRPEKTQKKRSIAMELSILFIGLLLLIMVSMLVMNTTYLTRFYELRLQFTLKQAYRQVDSHVSYTEGVDRDYLRMSSGLSSAQETLLSSSRIRSFPL